MSTVEFDKFVDLVERSQLVNPDQLREAAAACAADGGQTTPDQIAAALVERRLLTRWQADNLLKGKHKGFQLGRYRLLDQLGRGGMSTVYLAEHQLMKRLAAIKVLPRQRVNDRSYLGRFLREAQATASLDHPNIVRVYDIAAEGKVHYIAMEYVEGRDLQTLVADEGPLDPLRAADYIAQSAVGLQHAHDQGLTHRDIKPANLIANPEGIVKILDLGLARFHDESMPSLTIAHEDNVLGTVDYLAPEQAEDSHGVDSRADIYSLGCTLYFLLTGHPPFPKGTLAQRVLKHQKQQAPPIRKERPSVPFELDDLCRRMMQKDPAKRIQTALEVAEELCRFLERAGVHSPASGPLSALRQQGQRQAVSTGLRTGGGPLRGAAPPISGPSTRGAPISGASHGVAASSASAHSNEHLDLAPIDEQPPKFAPTPGPKSSETTETAQQAEPIDERWEQQVSILEQELTPLEASSHDSLLSGERIKIERRLPPSDSSISGAGHMPAWAWWTIGTFAVTIVLVMIIALLLR